MEKNNQNQNNDQPVKNSQSFLQKLDKWIIAHSKVKAGDKIFFTQNLRVMLKSGISLTDSLKTLALQTNNKKFTKVLMLVRDGIEQGQSLHSGLKEFPDVFSELFTNMIDAGEKSGQLEEILEQLTIQLKKSHALKSKIKGAMIYPAVIVFAMIGIGIAMMVFVVPKITNIFKEAEASLPIPTQILIGTSDFILNNWIIISIVLTMAIIGVTKYLKTPDGHHYRGVVALKIPLTSEIIKKINLAKFARTFGSLLKSGIPIVQTFQITAKTMGNSPYRKSLEKIAEGITQGQGISDSLKKHPNLYPPLILQMISVGEETGTFDVILDNLATFYEEEVSNIMGSLSSIIEPVLILILGLGVGGLAIAIIMPMYSLTQQI